MHRAMLAFLMGSALAFTLPPSAAQTAPGNQWHKKRY